MDRHSCTAMSQETPVPLHQLGADARDALDDATWLDVIHKMDEVYSKLVSDEIELEERTPSWRNRSVSSSARCRR